MRRLAYILLLLCPGCMCPNCEWDWLETWHEIGEIRGEIVTALTIPVDVTFPWERWGHESPGHKENMMKMRKCCNTPKGSGPHSPGCPQGMKKSDFRRTMQSMSASDRRAVFESAVDDDLPDGAYFAMAEEFGLEPEDFAG